MSAITDVGGIRVGQHERIDADVTLGSGWASGTTVVLTPPGTVGAVDCRGGAPGTRETDLLDPINSVRHVDAVVLSGGSAYGLAAADGVMRWLEEQGRGVAMDGGVVPIVPAAVVFDLPVGGWDCRPTAEFGYAAAGERIGAGGPWHRRCGDGRTRRRAQGRGRNRVDHACRYRCHGRRDRRRQRRGRRRRPGDRAAVAGRPDRRVRAGSAARGSARRLRRPAHRAQPAQHHHRGDRHRRRDERGRVPPRRGRRP